MAATGIIAVLLGLALFFSACILDTPDATRRHRASAAKVLGLAFFLMAVGVMLFTASCAILAARHMP